MVSRGMTLILHSVPSAPSTAAFPCTTKVQCATIALPKETAKLEKVPLLKETLQLILQLYNT